MASCSFTHNGRTFTLTVDNSGYDVSSNTSSVHWTLSISGSGGVWYDSYAKATVNGSVVYNRSTSWDGGFPAQDGSVDGYISGIGHNADGTGSIGFALEGYSYSYDTQYTSGGLTLDTIPRASQPSCITYPETTQDVGDIGGSFYIHMNSASSSFRHTVRYDWCGVDYGTIATDVQHNCQWTIPMSFCDRITDHTTQLGTIYVDTYDGSGNFLGTKSVTFTCHVPDSVVPGISACSVGIKTQSGIENGLLVQGLTVPNFTISASGAYSSTISKYQVVLDSTIYEDTENVVEALNPFRTSGEVSYKVTVTDSRGRTATESFAAAVYSYSAPSIGLKLQTSGTTVSVTYTGIAYSVNQKNTKALTIVQTKVSTGETEEYTPTLDDWAVDDGSQTFSGTLNLTVEDAETQTYKYAATFTDKTASAVAEESTGIVALSLYRGGKGAAFFQEAEEKGLVINGDAKVNGTFTAGLANLLRIDHCYLGNTTVHGPAYFNVPVVDGCTCIGIVGCYASGAETVYITDYWISDSTATFYVKNDNNWEVAIYAFFLYAKS